MSSDQWLVGIFAENLIYGVFTSIIVVRGLMTESKYLPLGKLNEYMSCVKMQLSGSERDDFIAVREYFLERKRYVPPPADGGLVMIVGNVPGQGPSEVFASSGNSLNAIDRCVNEVLEMANFSGPVLVGYFAGGRHYLGAIKNAPKNVSFAAPSKTTTILPVVNSA